MATATTNPTVRPAASKAVRAIRDAEEPRQVTLLELVRAIGEVTDDEAEVVATVLHMLRTGSVRLTGNFADAPVELFFR